MFHVPYIKMNKDEKNVLSRRTILVDWRCCLASETEAKNTYISVQ